MFFDYMKIACRFEIITKMAYLSKVIFSGSFLVILTSILLHSCTKDQVLPDDDFIIDMGDHLLGKMKSDFGTHAILKPDSTLFKHKYLNP